MRRKWMMMGVWSLFLAGCGAPYKAPLQNSSPIRPTHSRTAAVNSALKTTTAQPIAVDPMSTSLIFALVKTPEGRLVMDSRNGGQQWNPLGTISGSHPTSLQFLSPQKGFAIGPHSIWSTQNGGQS